MAFNERELWLYGEGSVRTDESHLPVFTYYSRKRIAEDEGFAVFGAQGGFAGVDVQITPLSVPCAEYGDGVPRPFFRGDDPPEAGRKVPAGRKVNETDHLPSPYVFLSDIVADRYRVILGGKK